MQPAITKSYYANDLILIADTVKHSWDCLEDWDSQKDNWDNVKDNWDSVKDSWDNVKDSWDSVKDSWGSVKDNVKDNPRTLVSHQSPRHFGETMDVGS